MAGWVGPAIGAIGAIGSAALGYYGTKEANRLQREAAREQNAFQERMSNTAYQRAMQDMSEAGLNPMLAYNQGGAASQMGAKAEMQSPVLATVNSAMDSVRTMAEIRRLNAETAIVESKAPKERLHGRGYAFLDAIARAVEHKVLNEVHSAKSNKNYKFNAPFDAEGNPVPNWRSY